VSSVFEPNLQRHDNEVDATRRLVLTGAVAAVAAGLLVAGLPSTAEAQHSRRRSRRRRHSRRRSERDHSRRRSSGHGRRRSRWDREDWNENCFFTPFGWICVD
jgi:hypothetical protein